MPKRRHLCTEEGALSEGATIDEFEVPYLYRFSVRTACE